MGARGIGIVLSTGIDSLNDVLGVGTVVRSDSGRHANRRGENRWRERNRVEVRAFSCKSDKIVSIMM